jgi:hypothetical protein
MKARSQILVHGGPVEGAPARRVTLGSREWELTRPANEAGAVWTWRRAGLFLPTWWLASERGTHLVLHEVDVLRRHWRAEAATGGWTLRRSWTRTTTLTDDGDATLFTFHGSWFGRERIEPASGPELVWRRDWFRGYVVESGEGHELLRLARAPGILSRTMLLTQSDAVRTREDLLPLLAIVWLVTLAARHPH